MRRTPFRTVLLVLLLLLLPSARPALLILLLPILLPPLLLRQLVADQPFEEVQAVAVWVKLKSLAARVVGGLQAEAADRHWDQLAALLKLILQ